MDRWREEVALTAIAPFSTHEVKRVDRFDAFSGDLQIERVGHLNNGVDDELAAGRRADRFRAALTERIAPPVLDKPQFRSRAHPGPYWQDLTTDIRGRRYHRGSQVPELLRMQVGEQGSVTLPLFSKAFQEENGLLYSCNDFHKGDRTKMSNNPGESISRRTVTAAGTGLAPGLLATRGLPLSAQEVTPETAAATPVGGITPLGYVTMRMRPLDDPAFRDDINARVIEEFLPAITCGEVDYGW